MIKSTFNKIGDKRYYITDENDNILHDIVNTGHMKWILSGDNTDNPDYIEIKEDVLYDLNDDKVINTIKSYLDIYDKIINKDKIQEKIDLRRDTYSELSVRGKIVYLFEASICINNVGGIYFRNYNDDIYLFSEASKPEFLVYDDYDFEMLDQYFVKLGKIEELRDPLYFNCYILI
jgi:hypothetical protein